MNRDDAGQMHARNKKSIFRNIHKQTPYIYIPWPRRERARRGAMGITARKYHSIKEEKGKIRQYEGKCGIGTHYTYGNFNLHGSG